MTNVINEHINRVIDYEYNKNMYIVRVIPRYGQPEDSEIFSLKIINYLDNVVVNIDKFIDSFLIVYTLYRIYEFNSTLIVHNSNSDKITKEALIQNLPLKQKNLYEYLVSIPTRKSIQIKVNEDIVKYYDVNYIETLLEPLLKKYTINDLLVQLFQAMYKDTVVKNKYVYTSTSYKIQNSFDIAKIKINEREKRLLLKVPKLDMFSAKLYNKYISSLKSFKSSDMMRVLDKLLPTFIIEVEDDDSKREVLEYILNTMLKKLTSKYYISNILGKRLAFIQDIYSLNIDFYSLNVYKFTRYMYNVDTSFFLKLNHLDSVFTYIDEQEIVNDIYTDLDIKILKNIIIFKNSKPKDYTKYSHRDLIIFLKTYSTMLYILKYKKYNIKYNKELVKLVNQNIQLVTQTLKNKKVSKVDKQILATELDRLHKEVCIANILYKSIKKEGLYEKGNL